MSLRPRLLRLCTTQGREHHLQRVCQGLVSCLIDSPLVRTSGSSYCSSPGCLVCHKTGFDPAGSLLHAAIQSTSSEFPLPLPSNGAYHSLQWEKSGAAGGDKRDKNVDAVRFINDGSIAATYTTLGQVSECCIL